MDVAHDPRPARLAEHYGAALAVARRHFPSLSRCDHEDVVQEAIAKVLQRLRSGPLEDPVPYLFRVVYTTGVEFARDRHRRTLPLEADGDDADRVALDVDRSLAPLSPEEHVLSRLDAGAAWRVLTEELRSDERRALALRMVAERTPAEIADELGTTLRHYRNIRLRGVRRFAAAMARETESGARSGGGPEPEREAA